MLKKPHREVPEELPYYLQDFNHVLNTVLEHDRSLLTEVELEKLRLFRNFSCDARCLVLRLFSRRAGWIRRSKISYTEMNDLDQAIQDLVAGNVLQEWQPGDTYPEDILETLRAAEYKTLLDRFCLKAESPRRADLHQALCEHTNAQNLGAELRQMDRWLQLNWRELLDTILLLFFANPWQGLESFVISAMGHLNFPEVQLSRIRLFSNADERRQYQHLLQLRNNLEVSSDHAEMNIKNLQEALKISWTYPRPEHSASPGQQLCARAAEGIQRFYGTWLESNKYTVKAVSHWRKVLKHGPGQRTREHAIKRLLINLTKPGVVQNKKKALQLCSGSIRSHQDFSPAFRQDLQRRQRRLQKSLKDKITPGPAMQTAEAITLWRQRLADHKGRSYWMSESGSCCVEDCVLEYFQLEHGARGQHLENAFPRALLGLLFWPVIYANVPGAFLHAFQWAPLDWGQQDFALKRQHRIQKILWAISRGQAGRIARQCWNRNAGMSNAYVNWKTLDPTLILPILKNWPAANLASLAALLIQHPKFWQRGFPDLSLLFPDGSFCFVEVKSPSDKLSLEQELWQDRLKREQVDVRLCLVEHKSPVP